MDGNDHVVDEVTHRNALEQFRPDPSPAPGGREPDAVGTHADRAGPGGR